SQGTIGYLGFEYAYAQKIPMALIQNSAGNYVDPTLESFSAAATAEMPADTRIMITNSPNPEAYPITSFTWAIIYKEQSYRDRTEEVATATVNALLWLTSPGAQAIATSVHYAKLPQNAAEQAGVLLRSITYNGEPIIK
ncbi:MAG: substrate-binding domain-containing protein, partial [Bacteroidales bacterium]|nr:substrate-binding domain-containing protein [Bacteroidales bacterium]